MDINEIFRSLNIDPNSLPAPLGTTIEGLETLIPIFSGYMNWKAHKKLNRAIQTNRIQIKSIINKLEEKEDSTIFKEEIFPIVFKKALDEDEEEKLKYLINGYDYLVTNDFKQIDKILNFYDVLEELRVNEIIFLSSLLCEDEQQRIQEMDIAIRIVMQGLSQSEAHTIITDRTHEYYMIRKLQNLALINPIVTPEDQVFQNRNIHISRFGRAFIEFFKEVE